MEELPALGPDLVLLLAQALEPPLAVRLRASQLPQEGLEGGLGVAFDADIHVAVAAQLRGVDIDLDGLGLVAEAPSVGQAEVQGRANDNDGVSAAQGGATGAGAEERVFLMDAAARHPVQIDGGLKALDKLL